MKIPQWGHIYVKEWIVSESNISAAKRMKARTILCERQIWDRSWSLQKLVVWFQINLIGHKWWVNEKNVIWTSTTLRHLIADFESFKVRFYSEYHKSGRTVLQFHHCHLHSLLQHACAVSPIKYNTNTSENHYNTFTIQYQYNTMTYNDILMIDWLSGTIKWNPSCLTLNFGNNFNLLSYKSYWSSYKSPPYLIWISPNKLRNNLLSITTTEYLHLFICKI